MKSRTYSIETVKMGGMGQKTALWLLKDVGIEAKPATTPYEGHAGIEVFGNERVQRRAERILFG